MQVRQILLRCQRMLVLVSLTAMIPTVANATQDEPSALEAAIKIEDALVAAISKAERSVVAITRVPKGTVADPTDPNFVPSEFGSGVVLDQAGHILTNYHVLGDPRENDYWIWLQHKPYQVVEIVPADRVRAADPWTDLAILKVNANDLEPIKFGDGSKLRKGQLVIALGNPYAIARDGEPSASWGMISNLSRRQTTSPSIGGEESSSTATLHQYGTLIQTDVRLELGTSGGALINLRGEMIGLTTALAAMDQFERTAGFAIPVDDLFLRAVEKLKQGEVMEYGFLGVSPRDLDDTRGPATTQGVSVAQVIDGTPAARAGIAYGDIITHLNSAPIVDSSTFMRELGRLPVGSSVQVSLSRRRVGVKEPQQLVKSVRLSKKYIDTLLPVYTERALPRFRGAVIDYSTAIPRFAERSRDVDLEGCVAVVSVERGSPMWNTGLRSRDFISHVGKQRVRTPAEFYTAVAAYGDRSVPITLTETNGGGARERVIPFGS